MRFMGVAPDGPKVTVQQLSVQVRPRETVYEFVAGAVALTLTFSTPTFQDERQWDWSSRPITYLSFALSSIDGASHAVQLYFDQTGELCVKDSAETITWNRYTIEGGAVQVLKMGRDQQRPLSGTDDLVDWVRDCISSSLFI